MSWLGILVILASVLTLVTPAYQGNKGTSEQLSRMKRQIDQAFDYAPTEEGQNVTLTCDYDAATVSDNTTIFLVMTISGETRVPARCERHDDGMYHCHVEPEFSSVLTATPNGTRIHLTWLADRRIVFASCEHSGGRSSWNFVTFVRPTSLRCSSQSLAHDSSIVSVACVADEIYPDDPRCVLYRQTGGGGRSQTSFTPSYGQFGQGSSLGATIGASCVFNIQVSKLGAGAHRLEVNMFPFFDDSDVTHGLVVTATPDVTLSYPVPEMINCPSGAKVNGEYIMTGSVATCGCRQQSVGDPPGWLVLSQAGATVESGSVNSPVVMATIKNPPDNSDQIFTCHSESPLGQSGPSVSITVKFAYGPSNISQTFSKPNPSNWCDSGNNFPMTSSCSIDPNTVNPPAEHVLIYISTARKTSVSHAMSSGRHFIRCRAENPMFPNELFVDGGELFTVRAPPKVPPKISVVPSTTSGTDDNGEVLVRENTTTTVKCLVEQKYEYPRIQESDVQLNCPTLQQDSSNVRSGVITRSRAESCSCTATHASGCYDKRDDITMRAAYGPEKITLKRKNVNPEMQRVYNMCPLSSETGITMECSVGAVYPEANHTLTVTRTGTQNVLTYTGGRNSSYHFVPTTGGTHEFQCVAVNSVFEDLRGESPKMKIEVREAPKTPPVLAIRGQTFTGTGAENVVKLRAGRSYSVTCRIGGGFPEISDSNVTVMCAGSDVTDGLFVPSLGPGGENKTTCSCAGQHPSGCYNLRTVVDVSLIASDLDDQDQLLHEEDSGKISLAVSVALTCGGFALGSSLTLVITCLLLKRCKQRKETSDETSDQIDRTPTYVNTSEVLSPATGLNQTPDKPDLPENPYNKIIVNQDNTGPDEIGLNRLRGTPTQAIAPSPSRTGSDYNPYYTVILPD